MGGFEFDETDFKGKQLSYANASSALPLLIESYRFVRVVALLGKDANVQPTLTLFVSCNHLRA